MLFTGLVFSFVDVDINLYKDTSIIIKQNGGDLYRPLASCFGLQSLKANYIISGSNNITKSDIMSKLNCKDIDSTVNIVNIQFVYDCIESNRIFTSNEIVSMGYIVYPKDNSIIDIDDNTIGKKRLINEDNKSNKKPSLSFIEEAQSALVITDSDTNLTAATGRWVFNSEKTVLFKLHSGLNLNTNNVEMIAFDMDGTLISTKSGKIFGVDEHDWKFWHPNVITTLKRLHDEGKYLAIISNQGAMKKHGVINTAKVKEIQTKVDNIIKAIGVPFDFICAVDEDLYRKPYPGMWHLLLKLRGDIKFLPSRSMYVGDAAGREKSGNRPKDFSDSDYKLAVNVGVPFQTPERFFLKSVDRLHNDLPSYGLKFTDMLNSSSVTNQSIFEISETQEIVLLAGPPACGKSSIATSHFKEYGRINQDTLKSIDKCLLKAKELLDKNQSIVIDNTNLDVGTRKKWIQLAQSKNIPIRVFSLKLSKEICQRLAKFRKVNPKTCIEDRRDIPTVAFNTYFKDIDSKWPQKSEGFSKVYEIESFNPIVPDDPRVFSLFNSVI